MAKRLATYFVKTCLQLSEAELLEFIMNWSEQHITSRVMVLDNGNQEILFLEPSTGEEMIITFERKSAHFVMSDNLQVQSIKLAELLRKAVVRYHGNAIVYRVYAGFTVVYEYNKGTVVKIIEKTKQRTRMIFEYPSRLKQQAQQSQSKQAEQKIPLLRTRIDQLLDERLHTRDPEKLKDLDVELSYLSVELFALEGKK